MNRPVLVLAVAGLALAAFLLLPPGARRDRVGDLASHDPEVVVDAAREFYLDSVRGVDVGPELARGLVHASPQVRSRCVKTVARLGLSSYTGQIVDLLDDPDEAVRIQAAVALRTLRAWSSPAPLLRVLQDRRQVDRIRVDLAYALGQRREPRAAPVLERIAMDPAEPVRVRREALEALGVIGSVSRVPLLVRVLQDPDLDPRLRRAAARGLGDLHTPAARAALVWALARPERPAGGASTARRLGWRVGLGEKGGPQACPETVEHPGDAEVDRIRVDAARSLGCQRTPEEATHLEACAAAAGEPLLLRLTAARSLDDLGAPWTGRTALIQEGLEDEDWEVRSEAASLAASAGDPDLYDALQRASMRETDGRVRCSLDGALARLQAGAQVDPDSALAR